MSCFVYKVIRDLESIDHLCINPILRIGLIHKCSIDSRWLKWSVQFNVLLNNCKQNITLLSLLVGTTVGTLFCALVDCNHHTMTALLEYSGSNLKPSLSTYHHHHYYCVSVIQVTKAFSSYPCHLAGGFWQRQPSPETAKIIYWMSKEMWH